MVDPRIAPYGRPVARSAPPGRVLGRALAWGGTAGLCLGAVLGTELGFVIGTVVGAVVGSLVGLVLGLAGAVVLTVTSPTGPVAARWSAGLAAAAVGTAPFAWDPGAWPWALIVGLVCLTVGAALGPTVAFGPAVHVRPGVRRAAHAPILVAWCAAGAAGGLVAGLASAGVLAAYARVLDASQPIAPALGLGAYVGIGAGALVALLIGAVRSNPVHPAP